VSNREVAHLMVDLVCSIAESVGVPLDELSEGLPVDLRAARLRLRGLDWDLFVELFDRLGARAGRERLLAECARLPENSVAGRLQLGRFISPRLLLSFVCRVTGPVLYPMYHSTYEEETQPDGAVVAHLVLRLKDGFRGCRLLFDAQAISTAALPTFIGLAPLPVRAETTERGGEYWFTVKPKPTDDPRPRSD
jgi:hypothetical protein